MSKRVDWKFKSKFFFSLTISLLAAVGMATCAFSYSWFSNRNTISQKFEGKTAGAYFARGNGSETSPYVINKPIHLYNLAWLQYLGFFKEEKYFIIEKDLDMTNWTLPPIGTEDNPFIGHLDGFDKTYSIGQTNAAKISNLTISTSFDDYLRHPAKVSNSDFKEPRISGLFGVVGDKTSSLIPTIKNISIDKMEVQPKTSQALTGIVAGYVNGKLDNVLINDSNLNFASTTNKLAEYDYISKYTSVGYCESEYETKAVKQETTMYKPYFIGSSTYNPTSSGEAGVGWGGSVDMMSINRRLNYILTTEYDGGGKTVTSSTYDATIRMADAKEPYWNSSNTSYVYLCSGTYMPLNINKDASGLNVDDEITKTISSATWHYNSFYRDKKKEEVLTSNTGYIVGGGTDAIRARTQGINGISKSQAGASSGAKYDKAKMQVLTVNTTDSTPTTYKIIDENNKDYYSSNQSKFSYESKNYNDETLGFVKYSEVVNNFSSIMQDKTMIHGFHFGSYLNEDSVKNDTTNAFKEKKPATIDGKTYQNYEFVKGGLNFTVHKKGYITSLSGTYFSYTQHSLYDLFKVERTNDGEITNIAQIQKIYSNKNQDIIYQYYNDTSFNSSGLTLRFDFGVVNPKTLNSSAQNIFEQNAAYYFEYPLAPGDYVIGACSSGSTQNAYLMYLDIGANAAGEVSNAIDRTKIFELLTEITEAFAYPSGVEIVNFDNAILDKKIFCLTIGATYIGKASFNYKGNNETDISLNTSNSDTGVAYFDDDLTILNNSKELQENDKVHGDRNIIETERLSYFDYKKEDGSKQLFTFSRTKTNESYSESSSKQYSSSGDSTTFTPTVGLTLYDDYGEVLESNPEISRPTDFNTTDNVFSIRLLANKADDYSIDYLQECSFDLDEATNMNLCNITGYSFEISNNGSQITSNDYKIINKNTNYSLKINNVAI